MTRYLRLGYIVPRLVLLVVLFCVVEFGAGWALKRAVVQSGEGAIGARVEIGESAVSLLDARATLTDLRIANPKRPMENLLEAERIELDFDSDSLLRRKAIAEHGRIRGLRFGTPRETTGALDPEQPTEGTVAGAWLGDATKAAVKETADEWLANLEAKLSADVDDFESVRLARELSETWPARFDEIADEARSLQRDVDKLRSVAVEARSNPLRHADFLRTAPQRASELQQRLAALYAELESLPAEVNADKQRIELARTRDEQRLRQRLQADQLDPQSLTSHLLGDEVTSSLGELIGWVRWTREMIPTSSPQRATTPRARGVDVHFVGVRQRPDLLVRELQLAGTARLAGRPVKLTGTVTDFTTMPALHGEPMRVALETTGALPLQVRATIDRSNGVPTDDLLIDCPSFGLPKAQLGDTSKFALAMAPSTASLSVSVRVEGQRLSGEVQIVQDRVAMTPIVGPGANRLVRQIGTSVGEQVASLAKPATRVTLSGTLDQPQMAVWSTLGPAIAESLETAAGDIVRSEGQRQLADVQRRIADETASLDRLLAQATDQLASQIDGPRQEIERLASGLLGDTLGRGTFSFEQLGKRLPAGSSLFK
ncbi:MAG: TIGR03545 family protein [Planctomycetota bacterium]